MNLNNFFKANKEKPFLFFRPNKGNFGDDIIRLGDFKLAKENGLNIVKCNCLKNKLPICRKDMIIYIHGCGGIGNTYKGVAGWTRRLREKNNNLIVFGPSTAMTKTEDLERLQYEFEGVENMIFYARERTTYKFMKENFDFEVRLDSCPSLNLTKEDFDINNMNVGHRHKVLIFRKDKYEKTSLPKSLNFEDFDIMCDPATQAISFTEWAYNHYMADELVTNRLHSAIMGWILGCNVSLFANNYHKNRSMWEYCLKERGIKWEE